MKQATKYETWRYLTTLDQVVAYFEEAVATKDKKLISAALEEVFKALGSGNIEGINQPKRTINNESRTN
jgi:DNA-binding phage protein